MKMKLLALVCCIVIALICGLVIAKHRSRLSSRVHELRIGMTPTETLDLVGRDGKEYWRWFRDSPSADDLVDPPLIWVREHDGILCVTFRDGRVEGWEFEKEHDRAGSVLTRMLRW